MKFVSDLTKLNWLEVMKLSADEYLTLLEVDIIIKDKERKQIEEFKRKY